MRGIAKSFGGVRVLEDVDLVVQPGEVVALLGANGAGKSTLMKILKGMLRRDGGSVSVDGTALPALDPITAERHGISMLPQEISVMPDMTVAENIFLGKLPTVSRFGVRRVDDATMRSAAADILGQLGFSQIPPGLLVGLLPVAERRVIEIARALAADARLLVMDEPTAALTVEEAATIFRIIRRLKQGGTSVIYISHYLREVFEIADRIEVLRDGRNAGGFVTAETSPGEVVAAMLGGAGGDLFDAAEAGAAPEGAPLLTVETLSARGQLTDVSFSVHPGEIFGVFGLVGSGIELLGRVIYGAYGREVAGRMTLGGVPLAPRTPGEGKRAGIGFVAAERKKEGIIPDLTVRENLVAAHETGLFLSRAEETRTARHWIAALGIRARGTEQAMKTLSGGNQQKVCIGRWLGGDLRLLVLEEPTRGVDVGARRDLYMELRRLASSGLAILVLSSDVEEVAGLADRSIVLDRGRVVGQFGRGAAPAALMAATAAHARVA